MVESQKVNAAVSRPMKPAVARSGRSGAAVGAAAGQAGAGSTAASVQAGAAGASSQQAPGEAQEMKRKLVFRMGFAAVLILLLLTALALFDQLNSSEDEPEAPTFTEAVPVGRRELAQPVTQAASPIPDNSAAGSIETARPAEKPADEKPPVPESSAAPQEPPPRPEVHARPVPPRIDSPRSEAPRAEVPAAPRAEARPVPGSRAPAAAPAAPPAPQRMPEASHVQAAPGRAAPEALAPRPAAPLPRVYEPAPLRVAPQPPRLFSGYALQAGVFSETRRAEELHAKLTLNGIPSTLEARVHVGPFKTREEADAAREKMKSLGIDAVLLSPKGAKR